MAERGSLGGRSVIVTGGGRGLGLEIARALHSDGAAVVICGRDKEVLSESARSIGPAVVPGCL